MMRPVVVRSGEGLTMAEAREVTGLSERTLRRWHQSHRIARRASGSSLLFSYPALLMLMHEDAEALELLRGGRRADPTVVQYLEAAGVIPI